MQLSKNVKRAGKALLFLIILVLLMLVLDASFELDEASTEAMLTRYSKMTDIDTIFVGNSAGEMVDADRFSEETGAKAFNMCTPSQGLSISLKNIEMACRHHKIKQVILLMTLDTVNSESYDAIEHLYDRVIDSSGTLPVRIKNIIKRNTDKSLSRTNVNSEQSVNVWIPWTNETNHGIKNVRDNLVRRFSRIREGRPLGYEIEYDLSSVRYVPKDTDFTKEDRERFEKDIDRLSSIDAPADMITPDKLEILDEICLFCRDNDVDLKVIVTPHRSDYYDRFESFRQGSAAISAYLNDFISQRGFMYYNTEDDADVHKKLPDSYFYDWEHVKDEYADRATDYLTGIIEN